MTALQLVELQGKIYKEWVISKAYNMENHAAIFIVREKYPNQGIIISYNDAFLLLDKEDE